jgi:hypothetical protein
MWFGLNEESCWNCPEWDFWGAGVGGKKTLADGLESWCYGLFLGFETIA